MPAAGGRLPARAAIGNVKSGKVDAMRHDGISSTQYTSSSGSICIL